MVQYSISWFGCKAIRAEHILVCVGQWVSPLEYSCLIAPVARELSVGRSSGCEYSGGAVTFQEAAEIERFLILGQKKTRLNILT